MASLGFVLVWIVGCVLFDMVFRASGIWLMASGAFTYIVACHVHDVINRNRS